MTYSHVRASVTRRDPVNPSAAQESQEPQDPGHVPEDAEAATPTVGRGLRSVVGEDFSFTDAIGGWRGLVESTAPGLIFVVVYVASRALTPALVSSLAVAVLLVLVRLIQRTPLTQAMSGVLGVGIGVLWAWWTGRAEDYFAGGLLANVGYMVAVIASIAFRWPAVGVVVAVLRGQDMSWRTDPERSSERRRYIWSSWVMAGVFALRLAVQVPLYLGGQVAALGTAKLAMGVPLFAIALWITWLLVGGPAARAESQDRPGRPPR
jgi:hypothetical protein